MSVTEAGFRSEITRAFAGRGVFVRTMTQRFASGMPDLLTCDRGRTWFLELKFIPKHKENPPVSLTELQRFWMRAYQKHGGLAAWVVGIRVTPRLWWAYAGTDPGAERARSEDRAMVRDIGRPWDVAALMDHLERRAKNGRQGT